MREDEATSHPMTTENLNIHRDFVSGRRKAYAWGAGPLSGFLLGTCVYPVRGIFDRRAGLDAPAEISGVPVLPPAALRELDPDEVGIILFASPEFHDEIRAGIAAVGPFPVATIFLPARDEPYLADSSEGRALARSFWNREFRELLSKTSMFAPPTNSNRAVIWVWGLDAGGAERQCVLLATGLRQLGWEVTLLLASPAPEHRRAWLNELEAAGVTVRALAPMATAVRDMARNEPQSAMENARLLRHFHPIAAIQIAQTRAFLEQEQPGLVIAYLDGGNLVAGTAAALSGVPHTLLSGRNLNPSHFPWYWEQSEPVELERMADMYRGLLSREGTTLSANSTAGARSYEAWLEVEEGAVPVIPNAVVDMPGEVRSRDEVRRSLGLPTGVPVIAGVFRIATEKNPMLWLEVVGRCLTSFPDAIAVLVGDGPLRPALEAEADRQGLKSRVRFVGLQTHPMDYMVASDLLLLTSDAEGMPNVVLEAQVCGRPVVVTAVGGVPDAMTAPLRELMCPKGDTEALTQRCMKLLADPDLASELGDAARAHALRLFSPAMLAQTSLEAAGLR